MHNSNKDEIHESLEVATHHSTCSNLQAEQGIYGEAEAEIGVDVQEDKEVAEVEKGEK